MYNISVGYLILFVLSNHDIISYLLPENTKKGLAWSWWEYNNAVSDLDELIANSIPADMNRLYQ